MCANKTQANLPLEADEIISTVTVIVAISIAAAQLIVLFLFVALPDTVVSILCTFFIATWNLGKIITVR